MFLFTIRYLGFLKYVYGLPWLFDCWLKVYSLLTQPKIFDWIDIIEAEITSLPNVTVHLHKYGGLQFDVNGKEIGHIHSNGLLDMPLNRAIKQQLMPEGRIQDHHSFKNTGWISFYITTAGDVAYAIKLLTIGFALKKNPNVGRND